MSVRPRPVVLVILDGWGHSENTEANAIAAADTPAWDALTTRCASGLVHTSGELVGLPAGQMGNSEVGHLNLGAGRVIYQESTRITKAIEDQEFDENPALIGAIEAAEAADGTVHILGLVSPGGVHSYESHIHAMVRLAAGRGAQRIVVHAILDGRDTPPRSAAPSLAALEAVYSELGVGRTASIVGRYYAMDRDKRWDRVERAWSLYTAGQAEYSAPDAGTGLDAAYARGESDEFVEPTVVGEVAAVVDGDALVFMNFRADRAREISYAFTDPEFDGFDRGSRPELAAFVSLTEYAADIRAEAAFAPVRPANTLGEYVASLGLRQLRIAETEKYAHVTFFFNGGEESPYAGEDRILIPSPRVATYDLQPEMSAPEVTDALTAAIEEGTYDLIVCNYANADMVGHTGDIGAAARAVEALDTCLGRLSQAVDEAGGEMLITADHGNVEMMADPSTGQAHTAHTTNLVPLVYQGRVAEIQEGGRLCDVAPTLLAMMGLEQPPEMTGRSLLRFGDQ